MKRASIFSSMIAASSLAMAASGTLANTFEWVNENVTTATAQGMYVSGVEGDSKLNIFDAYTGTFYNGTATNFDTVVYSYIDLLVRNGSSVTFNNLYMGTGQSAVGGDKNTNLVISDASTVNVNWGILIGKYTNNNTMTVSGKSSVTSYSLGLTEGGTGSNNILTIDDSTVTVTKTMGAVNLAYGLDNTNNQIIIQNAGLLNTTQGRIGIGRFGHDNTLTVTGVGSRAILSNQLRISEGAQGYNNGLVLDDGGVLAATSFASSPNLTLGKDYIKLAGGFLALAGEVTSSAITNTDILVWNGTDWNGTYSITYCPDVASVQSLMGSAYTPDLASLAGFTFWTGGISTLAPSYTAGDANGDGYVDGFDFDILAQNFGGAGTWATGDFNNDSLVDGFDFDILAQNFGAAPASLELAPVPEPATAFLLALGGMGLLARRRQN